MYNLTIGIPSYKRPEMLEKLVLSILLSNIDRELIGALNIVVVDNDVERTAEPVIKQLIENNTSTFFQLHYYNYPIKGLSNVRNEILDKALFFQPDYIAFVDDDEYVHAEWLNELTRTVLNNHADFAVGPAIPVFENAVSSGLVYGFSNFDYVDQLKINYIHSGNLIIRTAFLLANNLRFDPRFNTLGAEDSYFGVSALKMGGSIYWAKQAIVYETIPAKRGTLSWLIKRKFRGGNTFVYILLMEKEYGKLLKKIIISLFYLSFGTLALLLTPFNFKYRYIGVYKISESLGAFSSIIKIQYHEYLKTR
jgi:succinoglycan biosynthesis protein ExoM